MSHVDMQQGLSYLGCGFVIEVLSVIPVVEEMVSSLISRLLPDT